MNVRYRLPLLIGKNISVERYNTYVNNRESNAYKLKRENNGDVFIVDMPSDEHEQVVRYIDHYFQLANGANPIDDQPIEIGRSTSKFIDLPNMEPTLSPIVFFTTPFLCSGSISTKLVPWTPPGTQTGSSLVFLPGVHHAIPIVPAGYIATIPAALNPALAPAPSPPARFFPIAQTIDIDLYAIQQKVLKRQDNGASSFGKDQLDSREIHARWAHPEVVEVRSQAVVRVCSLRLASIGFTIEKKRKEKKRKAGIANEKYVKAKGNQVTRG
ncbi:hypothetical protein BC937DRAFT_93024 [Endogone sp. FLAS-F59071]|nr:hypothetical protein BC937DRAFT_93024 [Endogone sp. FLAS-F59071]|eukprot:RUS15017.1 hypothetical protein BC937DRAFT_93024 [Endogone sp. FLAS-F59071]